MEPATHRNEDSTIAQLIHYMLPCMYPSWSCQPLIDLPLDPGHIFRLLSESPLDIIRP